MKEVTRVYLRCVVIDNVGCCYTQGGSNMTGTDLCVNKPQSVPVIFEPPCILLLITKYVYKR